MKSWMPFTRASNENLFNMPVISLHEETKGVRHSVGSILAHFLEMVWGACRRWCAGLEIESEMVYKEEQGGGNHLVDRAADRDLLLL